MAAIAQGGMRTVLAAAEIYRAALVGLVFERHKIRALMRTVAERLTLAPAAGAPPVTFSRLDFHRTGAFLGNYGFRHDLSLIEGSKRLQFDNFH